MNLKKINAIKIVKTVCMILVFGWVNCSTAQEIRINGAGQIYGNLSGTFIGPGIGFESSVSSHFTINADVNFGFQSRGSAIAFKPALHYYFSTEQKGFFIGPSFKYVSINEKDNIDFYSDNVYALGLSLGVKSFIDDQFTFSFATSPHYSLGSSNNPGDLGSVMGIGFNVSVGYRF